MVEHELLGGRIVEHSLVFLAVLADALVHENPRGKALFRKKRFSNQKIITRKSRPKQNYNQNFPNSLRQENPPSAYNWTHQNSSNNAQKDNLFTKFKTLHYNLLID